MRVILVVSRLSGHHVSLYLDQILEEFSRRSWTASVIAPHGASSSVAYQEVQARHHPASTHELDPPPFAACLPTKSAASAEVLEQLISYPQLRERASSVQESVNAAGVFFLSLDHVMYAMAIAGTPTSGLPVAGIQTRTRFLTSRRLRHRLAGSVFSLMTRRSGFSALAVLDSRSEAALNRGLRADVLVRRVPEARPQRLQVPAGAARARFDIAHDSPLVVLYGSLSMRKGVRELVTAAAGLDDSSLCVLLAGNADGPVKGYLDEAPEAVALRRQGRLITSMRYQSQTEIAELLTSADAIWLGYPGNYQGSSGVLEEAILYRTPVIATESGMIGERVRRERLGILVQPEDIHSVRETLEAIPLARHSLVSTLDGESTRRVDSFEATVCDLIAEAFEPGRQARGRQGLAWR